MASITLHNSAVIGDFLKPYVVAEMNTSHNGNLGKAKEMIDAAKEAGCDCVKFQSWTSDTLYSHAVYLENPITKRMADRFSLSESQLLELAEYCCKIGIAFSSTPYSKREVDFLVDICQVPYIKIASMDLNNDPFLQYVASKQVPIVLSTGMADLAEIHRIVDVIRNAGSCDLCLLHCVAEYPPALESINLNNIHTLREEFPDCPIGLSDHSPGVEVSTAAVALGACMIEKHLTLDKSKMGWDNDMAMEPDEMGQLVKNCANVCIAMGTRERVIGPGELEGRKKIRRSVVAAHNLKAGDVLTSEDLDCKRPGTGLEPRYLSELIGKRLLRDISADGMILYSDVKC